MEPDGRVITFLLGDELYAVNILNVQEVIPLPDITRVPFLPGFVVGVTNLRGEVLAIADLGTFFELPGTGRIVKDRVVVVEYEHIRMGFMVDTVAGVKFLDRERMMSPPEGMAGKVVRYLSSVLRAEDEVVLLLDLGKIVASEEFRFLQEKR